jgi:hypothetical protein
MNLNKVIKKHTTYLSSGYFGKVYYLDEETVVKYGSIHDGSFLWLQYCQTNPLNLDERYTQHHPKVYRIIIHKGKYVAFIKRYYENTKGNKKEEIQNTFYRFVDYMSTVGATVCHLTDRFSFTKDKYTKFWDPEEKPRIDIHNDNIMADDNGISILTDPIAGSFIHRYPNNLDSNQKSLFEDSYSTQRYPRNKFPVAEQL